LTGIFSSTSPVRTRFQLKSMHCPRAASVFSHQAYYGPNQERRHIEQVSYLRQAGVPQKSFKSPGYKVEVVFSSSQGPVHGIIFSDSPPQGKPIGESDLNSQTRSRRSANGRHSVITIDERKLGDTNLTAASWKWRRMFCTCLEVPQYRARVWKGRRSRTRRSL